MLPKWFSSKSPVLAVSGLFTPGLRDLATKQGLKGDGLRWGCLREEIQSLGLRAEDSRAVEQDPHDWKWSLRFTMSSSPL